MPESSGRNEAARISRHTMRGSVRLPTSQVGYLALVCGTGAFGGFLFGFDTAVISGAVGPLERQFSLGAALLGWTVSSALLGSVIGAAASGALSDRCGRKISLILAGVLFLVSAAGSALAPTLAALIAARLVGGIGVGIAGMIAPLYVAEVSPAGVRGRMVALCQLAITIGVLSAYMSNALLRQLADAPDSSAGHGPFDWIRDEVWRGMFAAEALPAAIFCAALLLVPESPRFLAKQGAYQKAEAVLRRLAGGASASAQIAEIRNALAREGGAFRELFSGPLAKPTFIAIYLSVFSQLSGIDVVIYYGPKIFEEAGFSFGRALDGQVLIGIILVLFTLVALWKVDRAGRRLLLAAGNAGVLVTLLLMGLFFSLGTVNGVWLIVATGGFIASFAFSLGPIPWIVMAEIFPTKLRGRAMALATLVLFATTGLLGQVFPWMVESLGAANTFWVLAAGTLPTFFFVWKILPETMGRTLEEIEQTWASSCRGQISDSGTRD